MNTLNREQDYNQNHTYASLRGELEAKLKASGGKKKVIENHMTALNSWLSVLGLRESSVVGNEMSVEFDRCLRKLMDELTLADKSKRTIQDRCEFMVKVQKLHAGMRNVDTLPALFSEALAEAMRRAGMSTGELARASGMDIKRVRAWEQGNNSPNGSRIDDVASLERALKLPEGTLSARLSWSEMTWAAARVEARSAGRVTTKFGERLRILAKKKFRYIHWPEGLLRSQWQQVIAYKTNPLREGAEPGNTWREKSIRETASRLSYANVLDGKVCAAADAAWGYIGGYLGWLTLKEEDGGCGLARERVCSLAWLTRHDKLFEYLSWRQRRAGVVNTGMVQLLNYACMLLRPESGWLWLNASLATTMEPRDRVMDCGSHSSAEVEQLWRGKCVEVHAKYMERSERLKKIVKVSRDPLEAIRTIICERRPLQLVMAMIAKLERMPPPVSAHTSLAVWLRDVLLLKMLASNPLRVSHFSIMRYRSDNTGNIYRKSDGGWALRFSSADFKNEKQAAQKDYDADIPRSIWPNIERYLAEGRPLLGRSCSEFFFLRAPCGPENTSDGDLCESEGRDGMWRADGISNRLRWLTAMLRPGCPGFRSHAFRYIVATDYLKRNPGAYVHVAHLLHDKLSTVMSTYGHLSVQDGLDRHFESFEEEWNAATGKKASCGDQLASAA